MEACLGAAGHMLLEEGLGRALLAPVTDLLKTIFRKFWIEPSRKTKRAYHSAGALHDFAGLALTIELGKANPFAELLAIRDLISKLFTTPLTRTLRTYSK